MIYRAVATVPVAATALSGVVSGISRRTVPDGAPAGGTAAAGAMAPETAMKMQEEPAPAGWAAPAVRTVPATVTAPVPDRGDGWGNGYGSEPRL